MKDDSTIYNWTGKTILIVEDNSGNYFLFKELIEYVNGNVIWSKDGIEAIECCKKKRDIDLVLMDLRLPKLNGFDTSKEILKLRPSLSIVATSASLLDSFVLETFDFKFKEFMPKPINQSLFYSKLDLHMIK